MNALFRSPHRVSRGEYRKPFAAALTGQTVSCRDQVRPKRAADLGKGRPLEGRAVVERAEEIRAFEFPSRKHDILAEVSFDSRRGTM